MNGSTLIKLSQKLQKELEFICESVSITDEDISPICSYLPLVSEKLTNAIQADEAETALMNLSDASHYCAEIDNCLILMYATSVISRETFTRIRNSYASLGRNFSKMSASIQKKQRLKK